MTDATINVSSALGKLCWTPENVGETSMDRFRRTVNSKFHLNLSDYHALWKWSCDNLSEFWATVWEETGVISSQPYHQVLPANAGVYPPPLWFQGAKLNFAENLLRRHKLSDRTAVIQSTEVAADGTLDEHRITFRQLYSLVAKVTRSLRRAGIQINDRVASYSANNIENLVTFLACASIGAIWTSAAADFGPEGVLERLRTVRPKMLLSVNAVRYNGKVHDHLAKLNQVIQGLETDRTPDQQRLETVIVVPYVSSHPMPKEEGILSSWQSLVASGSSNNADNNENDEETIEFEQLDFNHPLWILFSSGTTGKPKAIIHRAGGMLLQLSKEHLIHGELTCDDVFFQHTTTGWMMWNFLIGSLVSGCSIVLYDGSPLKPVSVLWQLAERHQVSVFGTSAAYLTALEKSGYQPKLEHQGISCLRQLLSTGSPLRADLYPWIQASIGDQILIGSVTGGTDLCSLFAGHNVAIPVRAGEIQARNLGMAIAVYDSETCTMVPDGIEGDLVCTKPFPAQPIGFYGQPNDQRYFESYYSQIKGVWYHGDYVMISSTSGGVIMLGRSDGILNPSGIRFGSSEIYDIIEDPSLFSSGEGEEIIDSLVVGLKVPPTFDDEVVVLFLVVSKSTQQDQRDVLKNLICKQIRNRRSARHVPKFIEFVDQIPKTLNGKRVEIPVKKLINGASIESINKSTLLNPDSLQEYLDIGQRLCSQLLSEVN